MTTQIINRGRGPEIAGTRVTVDRIMDYLREESASDRIVAELNLSHEQVEAALEYIAAHRGEVETEYERILERVRQANPAWIEQRLAKSPQELKDRLQAHCDGKL
ncbi:MAG: DUF433 domain-containing protein [Planctomycetaceae bacterium]